MTELQCFTRSPFTYAPDTTGCPALPFVQIAPGERNFRKPCELGHSPIVMVFTAKPSCSAYLSVMMIWGAALRLAGIRGLLKCYRQRAPFFLPSLSRQQLRPV